MMGIEKAQSRHTEASKEGPVPKRLHDTPAGRNPAAWTPRRDSVEEGFGYDPYESRHHLPEPTVCPGCAAVYHAGRWARAAEPPKDAASELCPACRRIRDEYPAGFLRLEGPFALERRDELLHLARKEADAEGEEHALHRIMGVSEEAGGILITTTDVHLPRRIGEAIHRAFHGELDIQYAAEDHLIRVRWSR